MSALNGLIERMDEKVGPLPVIGWIAIGGLGFAILAARGRAHAAPAGGAGTVTLAPGDTTNGVAATPDQSLAGMLAALRNAGASGPVNISLPGGGSAGFTLAPPEPAPNPAPLPDTTPVGAPMSGGDIPAYHRPPVSGGLDSAGNTTGSGGLPGSPPGLNSSGSGALNVLTGGGASIPPGGLALAPPAPLEIHPPIIGSTTGMGAVPLDIGPGGSLG